ncbi:MAG: site-specific DNA-methyltransferase [Luteolibacter sp.]
MYRPDLPIPDPPTSNFEKIAALFPHCVTEARDDSGNPRPVIDFDLLRRELSPDLVEAPRERYHLDWPGKRAALALAHQPLRKTPQPCPEESVDFESTRNLYIEGDNLDALKHLRETCLGQVKMIYIDPPYNTGGDFIYPDRFAISHRDYKNLSSETSGRFHTSWLSMIYPRLVLARDLLHDEGFLFVSISDRELHNLIAILDQVFGEENRVETFIWESIFRPSNMSRRVRGNAEFVIAYAKNSNRDFELVERYEDPKGDASLTQNNNSPRALTFPPGSLDISLPSGIYQTSTSPGIRLGNPLTVGRGTNTAAWTVEGRFKWSQKYLDAEIAKGVLLKVKTRALIPSYRKTYQKTPLRPRKIIPRDLVGDVLAANAEIRGLFGKAVFDYPKPTSLITFLMRTFGIGNSDLVLDFFSGSATTAHAVMKLNTEDGGKRRYIMVQLPEPCDPKSAAFKAGYQTIAEIGKERIRRAGRKILDKWRKDAPPPDIGFRVFK